MTPVPPRIYLQDTCLKHKFIRSKENGDVYERPERIRAVNIGIAALYARLESANPGLVNHGDKSKSSSSTINGPLTIVRSSTSLDMRVHKASLAVHSGEDPDGTQWCLADDIDEWCVQSLQQIQHNKSEIPEKYEQDLYLCPESLQAFEAALGTVCEAVDSVCRATGVANEGSSETSPSRPYKEVGHPSPRAFVVIRPPGHHCGEDSPAGFGFVNNVAVGAFHAFEEHRLSRVVIFDVDLHHGNGTQELVRAYQTPKIYYGSMHDILSYPCEAGNQELISDASLQLHGEDGEWIHNVHILPYKTEQEFWKHYKERYSSILTKAEEFLQSTGGPGDDIIVFMSCGFDASEYETTEMSRHDRHVPTSFYHRFTREACAFADKWAGGRLVSVLEGGYSDRALTSGAISHIAGLAEAGGLRVEKEWWSNDELNKIEKITAKRRGRRPKLDHCDWWLQRMQQVFQNINKDTPPVIPLRTSQLFVPPMPPPPREDTPETTPVRMRKRRTKPPPPPPTQMVTRKSKRSSPDDYEHAEPSVNKRRRVDYEEKQEEEESSDDDMDEDGDDRDYRPPRWVDKGKGRAVSSPNSSPTSKPNHVLQYVGNGDVYKGRSSANNPPVTTGLPTPLPSLENIPATEPKPSVSTQPVRLAISSTATSEKTTAVESTPATQQAAPIPTTPPQLTSVSVSESSTTGNSQANGTSGLTSSGKPSWDTPPAPTPEIPVQTRNFSPYHRVLSDNPMTRKPLRSDRPSDHSVSQVPIPKVNSSPLKTAMPQVIPLPHLQGSTTPAAPAPPVASSPAITRPVPAAIEISRQAQRSTETLTRRIADITATLHTHVTTALQPLSRPSRVVPTASTDLVETVKDPVRSAAAVPPTSLQRPPSPPRVRARYPTHPAFTPLPENARLTEYMRTLPAIETQLRQLHSRLERLSKDISGVRKHIDS